MSRAKGPPQSEFDIREYLRCQRLPHFMCAGCGHGIALRALLWAVHELAIAKHRLVVISGIGCSGRVAGYIDANTFHVTHGRPLAFASGLKLARPELEVIVITGDGDCLAIGGNHLIHCCRRNLDLTCVMLNNEVYAMTGGQGSPTTGSGRFTTTTPYGSHEPVFDACRLAAAAGAGLVGRELTMHVPPLRDLLREAIAHRGFSFIEVISDCPEILGRRNQLGTATEMVLSHKATQRPRSYGLDGERLQAVALEGGVLTRNQRPEYGEVYRETTGSANPEPPASRAAVGRALAGREFEIRLSGSGGQGLVLSGKILAEALMLEGWQVAVSQSYEPTSRGGLCRSDLVVSSKTVEYPLATVIDYLVILDQVAANPPADMVKPDGLVLIDSDLVSDPPEGSFTLIALPFTAVARQLGNPRSANMVALGALAKLAGLGPTEILEQAIRDLTPAPDLDCNLAAVRKGQEMTG